MTGDADAAPLEPPTGPPRAGREGAAGRPGSQETSLRPQSREALVERGGSQMHKHPVRPVGRRRARWSRPPAAGGRRDRPGRGDARHARAAHAPSRPSRARSPRRRRRTRAPGTSAGGALERATGGDWDGRWARSALRVQTHPRRAHASDAGDPPELLVVLASTTATSSRAPATTAVTGTATRSCSSPSCFGDGLRRARRRCASPRSPASAQPGQAFDVRVAEYAVTFDANFNATTTQVPAAGATVTRRRADVHRRRRRRRAGHRRRPQR